MSLKVLWAAWSNEPSTETIERHLAAAVAEAGGTLLRVVEGRRPADDGIPTIDLQDALLTEHRRVPPPGQLPPDFDRIVTDTHAFEHLEGSSISLPAVEARLRRCAAHTDVILRHYQPDAVLVWNGMLSQRAVIAAMARQRGIGVWYCERGMFPGSWYADPVGINAVSSLVRAPLAPGLPEALDAPLSPQRRREILDRIAEVSRAGASAWGQPPLRGPQAWRSELGIPAGARVVFFPLQVNADTNMQFFSPYFDSSVAALAAVVEALAASDDWFLLVKPHPKGSYPPGEVDRVTARARRGRVIADINLHDALALASLVVTINSNVAAEAVWSQRPVLQLGRGVLTGKRIVSQYEPGRAMLEQLHEAAAAWAGDGERFERGLRFYDYLQQHFLLDASSPADAGKLVVRLRSAVAGRPASPPNGDVASLVRQFTWQPAVELFDRLARRQNTWHAALVGFGQNARRVMLAVPLHEHARRLRWSVWDDSDAVRQYAVEKSLPLLDPWSGRVDRDTVLVVTPRDGAALGQRLQRRGYAPEHEWLYLIPPR